MLEDHRRFTTGVHRDIFYLNIIGKISLISMSLLDYEFLMDLWEI